MTDTDEVRELIIIGGGPAGYTAALYAARGNLRPLVFEGFRFGGQLMITSDVENYPGFEEGVLGPVLMGTMRAQAERFGAELVSDDVTRVDFSERPFKVYVGDEEYRAASIVIATGATARQLGLGSEVELQGKGVSYCATCDGPFFRQRRTRGGRRRRLGLRGGHVPVEVRDKVTLVHRRDEFRASKIMIDHARAKDNVEFVTNATRDRGAGNDTGKVTGVKLTTPSPARQRELDSRRAVRRHRPRPRNRSCSRGSWTWTTRATCWSRTAPPPPTSKACSPAVTSSTTSTGRR